MQPVKGSKLPEKANVQTKISFRGFDGRYATRCPNKQGTIALRVLSHFVPLFISGNAPKIIINDGESIDIEALFADSIVQQETTLMMVDIDGEQIPLTLWSLKCNKSVRFDGGGYNFAFITANNRSVVEYSIDDQLGLRQLEGEFIYLGSASGEYLDLHVNAERTGFTLDNSDIDSIKRSIAKQAREFLRPYVEEALAEKVKTTHELITENLQFLYVQPTIKDFAEGLQPNLYKREDIFVELSRNRFRRQRTFASLEKQIERPILLIKRSMRRSRNTLSMSATKSAERSRST